MTKVKICGLKRKEDIIAVNEAKPDYIGFVFAKSRRRVSVAEARELKSMLLPGILAVGVFVDENPELIEYVAKNKIIDLIQLHGREQNSYLESIRNQTGLPIIRSVPVKDTLPPIPAGSDFLLLDGAVDGNCGGLGTCFSWEVLKDMPDTQPYFLAGGLTPENVREPAEHFRPFAVDVSSGVETGGVKDPDKIKKFVNAVRTAGKQGREHD